MRLYVKVTKDKYELPEAVAESPKELAKMLGTSANSASSSISHKRRGWLIVDVDPEDEEDKGES